MTISFKGYFLAIGLLAATSVSYGVQETLECVLNSFKLTYSERVERKYKSLSALDKHEDQEIARKSKTVSPTMLRKLLNANINKAFESACKGASNPDCFSLSNSVVKNRHSKQLRLAQSFGKKK